MQNMFTQDTFNTTICLKPFRKNMVTFFINQMMKSFFFFLDFKKRLKNSLYIYIYMFFLFFLMPIYELHNFFIMFSLG